MKYRVEHQSRVIKYDCPSFETKYISIKMSNFEIYKINLYNKIYREKNVK